jgi:acyl-[acyl carrier protein]--UDP-N-acetylglucosamine O-acyltransferase
MRRGGIDAAARRQVQAAFRVLYRSGLVPAAALARLKQELGGDPLVTKLVDFIEGSKRGIVPAARAAATADAELEERIF